VVKPLSPEAYLSFPVVAVDGYMATCDGLGGERTEYVGEAITELGEGRYLECEEGGSRLVASVNDASLGIV
jgi:hypothetical protein